MENRHQHDASIPNLPSCSLPVEWLLEESRQLREEKTTLLHHRQTLLHQCDLLFHHQLLLIERLKAQLSRLQTLKKDTPPLDGGQRRSVEGTEKEDGD